MTKEGDLVLVYMEKMPAFFARIEDITADVKPGWFQVKMLVLQVPVMLLTWILREAYINGEEFTMGGRPIRMEKVVSPEEANESVSTEKSDRQDEQPSAGDESSNKKGKVVSILDRKKKNQPS